MDDDVYELRHGEPYVCDRHVAWRTMVVCYDAPEGWPDDLPFLNGRGFHVPLENGLILSTQWGAGNYCANYEARFVLQPEMYEFHEACPDAELACWWDAGDGGSGDRGMLKWPDGDIVTGYFPATHWWQLVALLSVVPTQAAIQQHCQVKELMP